MNVSMIRFCATLTPRALMKRQTSRASAMLASRGMDTFVEVSITVSHEETLQLQHISTNGLALETTCF